MEIKLNGRIFHCPLDLASAFIGGKWKTVVLWYLCEGKKRFGELKKQIPNITEKMLSLQLKQLEKDGFVFRKIYAEVPPRVEYSLTEEGKTLIPILEAMCLWGKTKAKTKGVIQEVIKKTKKKKISR